jgi:ResB-like family
LPWICLRWLAPEMLPALIRRIYRILISLQLAVVLLSCLTLSLVVATTLESRFDTPTAQYFVYRAGWFYLLLLLLGINILAVALSRLPWKMRHAPFLAAHAGILLLLVGAWVTQRWGVDGMLRVEEGDTQSTVEIDEPQILVQDDRGTRMMPFPWRPPGVAFSPVDLGEGLRVEEFLSRADPVFSFEPSDTSQAAPAVQLKFTTKRSMGGMPAMAASQEIWLWEGSPDWQSSSIGPARVFLGKMPDGPGPWIWLQPTQEGGLSFEAVSMRGEKSKGRLSAEKLKATALLDPGWKAIQIEVLQYRPRATPKVDYLPAKIQYGPKAPPSAIRVRSAEQSLWLGLGDRATFGHSVVAYFPRRVTLPFGIRLDRFMLERYPGSFQAASFSSRVTVSDSTTQKSSGLNAHLISMNEPLEWRGFTFYQSSYEEGMPRPRVSIFSVNQDPGRGLKYWGSLILVLGIVWFYLNKRKAQKKA